MVPFYLNSSPPSPFPSEVVNEDQSLDHYLSPNSRDSSSSTLSYQFSFNSVTNDSAQVGYVEREMQPLQHQQEGDNFGTNPYDHVENANNTGLKFSIWKEEITTTENQSENQVKWMSSKMRVMLKMKKPEQAYFGSPANNNDHEGDQKVPSSPVETSNSCNNSSNNSNVVVPIRVCSDCNTTKTPLWRSGPRGPKSLCNACGIRQRKARKAAAEAAAAAAAAETGENHPLDQTPPPMPKVQLKDKKANIIQATKIKKKPCKITLATPPSTVKKNCFEDFLINLSNNLAIHRVFPQDEKEAAILLMALSCGYIHS